MKRPMLDPELLIVIGFAIGISLGVLYLIFRRTPWLILP